MIQTGLVSLALLAFAHSATLGKQQIPDSINLCHRNDPNLNDCLRDLLQTFIQDTDDGKNSIESMVVDEVIGGFTGAGYSFNHQLNNMSIKGLSKTKLLSVRADLTNPKDMKIELDISVPEVRMAGYYKMEGYFSSMKLQGHGPFSTNATDVTSTIKVGAYLSEKDGVKYIKVHKVDMAPKIKVLKANFDNIVDGNPELSEAWNKLFNEFWRPGYEKMLPYLKEMFDKVARKFVNEALFKVPYDDLLPE